MAIEPTIGSQRTSHEKQAKGTAVIIFPEFVQGKYGPEGLAKWRDALSPASREIFGSKIDIGQWYPFREGYLEPTIQICRTFFGDEEEGARQLGRFSAEYALKWFYRSVIKLTTVRTYVERGGTMITNYFRPCQSQTVSVKENQALVRISEFPENHPLIELRIAAWMQRAMELRGCQEAAVSRPKSMCQGDPYTDYLITWS